MDGIEWAVVLLLDAVIFLGALLVHYAHRRVRRLEVIKHGRS